MKAICTTTINAPTKAIKKFIKIAKKDDWHIFIAGDTKTPHKEYQDIGYVEDCVTYLTPEEQEKMSKELSDLIGWKCIQRRNFAILAAYQAGAEIMALIDDDNIPYENWGKSLKVNSETNATIYNTNEPVFDPLSPLYPHLWHRGFPIQLLDSRQISSTRQEKRKVLVQADLWDGDPDIDAVARITLAPLVRDQNTVMPYGSNKQMPFNSQNTFISRDILPTYFLFPHIGRMDDIWAAYITQREFPNSVVFSSASVWQERNPHDLSKDLEAELIGYKHSLDIVNGADLKKFVPAKTIKAYEVWKGLINA